MNLTKIAEALRALADAIEEEGIQPKVEVEVVAEPPPPVEEPEPVSQEKQTPPTFAFGKPSEEAAPAPGAEVTSEDLIAAFQDLSQKKGQKVANETLQQAIKHLGIRKATEGDAEQRAYVFGRLQGEING